MYRSKGRCEACNFHCPWILEVHHIKPVSSGKVGLLENLVALCPNCHRTVEMIKTPLSDDPRFDDWIRTEYDWAAQRLIDLAYTSDYHTWVSSRQESQA